MADGSPVVPGNLDEFPDDIREDVEGLIWLGHLEDEFEYCGHRFVLRTLKGDEELYAGVLAKEFMDTMTQGKAWAWANIAQSIVSVDGDEDWCKPIGADKLANARGRFNYCIGKWYWHVGDHLFYRYRGLVGRQIQAVNAIRDLSPGSLTASTPSPGSLIGQEDSKPNEDIRELLD